MFSPTHSIRGVEGEKERTSRVSKLIFPRQEVSNHFVLSLFQVRTVWPVKIRSHRASPQLFVQIRVIRGGKKIHYQRAKC